MGRRSRRNLILRQHLLREEGGIFVEFALALPLLLFLVSGIVDIGLGLNEHAARLQATRTAARRIARISAEDVNKSNAIFNDFAVKMVPFIFEKSSMNINDYDWGVYPATIDVANAVKAVKAVKVIVRRKTPVMFFLPASAIRGCTAAIFRLEWDQAEIKNSALDDC